MYGTVAGADAIWVPALGYEGLYEVSRTGEVRSVTREVAFGERRRVAKSTVLRGSKKPNGYLFVLLYGSKRKPKCCHVHRIVAESFLGKPLDPKMVVNHLDGDKANNAVDNLEWCSHSRNIAHSYEIGLRPRGVPKSLKRFGLDNPGAKLGEATVTLMREQMASGETASKVAASYGVSPSYARRIRNGQVRVSG